MFYDKPISTKYFFWTFSFVLFCFQLTFLHIRFGWNWLIIKQTLDDLNLEHLFSSLNILCAKQWEHFIDNFKNTKVLQSRLQASAISETQDLQNKKVKTCYQNNKSRETIVKGEFNPWKHFPVKSLLKLILLLLYWHLQYKCVLQWNRHKICAKVCKCKESQTTVKHIIQNNTGLFMTNRTI